MIEKEMPLIMRHIKSFRLLFLVTFSLFCVGMFSVNAPKAEGVPAAPVVVTYELSNGRVVFFRPMGDEFFNYTIDANGDLVTFGDDGDVYYAKWASESDFWENDHPKLIVPTKSKLKGVPASTKTPEYEEMAPLRSPIPRYILESALKLREYNYKNPEFPTIITVTLPRGVINENYSKRLGVFGGTTPISWTIDSGILPDGLSLDQSGVISGTPTSVDTFKFTTKATNAAGSDTQTLTIKVTLFEEKDEKDEDEKDDKSKQSNGGGCNTVVYALIMISMLPFFIKW
jgi:hypothetical protein